MLLRTLASASLVAFSSAISGCAASADDVSSASEAAESASAGALAHEYRGTVAGLDVMMRIAPSGTTLTGSYFYVGKVTKGETIALKGSVAGSRFTADESVNGTKTGSFSGAIAANGNVDGTWSSPDGRQRSFSLEPVKTLTVVKRAAKDSAAVADPDAPFHECSIDIRYLDVFGVSDEANDAALDTLLATDASPLEKTPTGKCDWWNTTDSTSTVKLQEKGLLVVEMSAEYDGGAYPNHSLMWVNANAKTGKVLTLGDIVEADKMVALRDKTKSIYKASKDGADDFLLETVDNAFGSPSTVQFELTKQGLRISMFNALPHAAQAEDGDGALVKWADLADLIIPTSPAAVLAR
jgi:hypothetical protein